MSEVYTWAEDAYKKLSDTQKEVISLEFLYNAMCFYHLDWEKVVDIIMKFTPESRATLESSLCTIRLQAQDLISSLKADNSQIPVEFIDKDAEDIYVYQIANGLEIR